jgi:hypothetical protein
MQFLEQLGPSGIYGLKEIELRRAPAGKHIFIFGRYEAPSKICLFEQEKSPWLWPKLPPKIIRFLRMAGAQFDSVSRQITWSGHALNNFMLRHVLLHELGHHRLQYYVGKRREARARERDHEAYARLHARRERKRIEAE